ncbi:hypothetical protein RRG08_052243 [Elysia crispata]|uniref:G-protein coupled receptors family 1 profile domain-containing protein n=1 Tax=Elysia crispata TaxID=231223 RepID=A0AAE1E6X4_9GAST|nr:hypothetical protein RRG08_052243 [Elysia crispata]
MHGDLPDGLYYSTLFIPRPDAADQRRSFYFISSFSAPSFICFFVVLVSTTVLVVRLKQNLEWRNEAAKQSNKNSGSPKEIKASRSLVVICTVFIICFAPSVALFVISLAFPEFTQHDPYLGTLMRALYAISSLVQVLSSSVNIVVYYRMSTKYRNMLNELFSCKKDITS